MNGSSKNPGTAPIFLDYNATTPLDPVVIEEINKSLVKDWGNPSSSHVLGRQAKAAIERSRIAIARMLNANPEDIVFTSGGTEANNISLLSAIHYSTTSADHSKPHVITSNVEHDSIALVLQEQLKRGNIDLTLVEVDQNGKLHYDSVLSLIRDTTCLISIMHANNESGVIMPIDEIGDKLLAINEERKVKGLRRIVFHCDAAQTVGKIEVDVKKLKVDMLTVVGHKFYAPRIGALYVKGLTNAFPLRHVFQGGGQERGFRPGTENTPMIVGLGKASELVYENLKTYTETMRTMRDLLNVQLQDGIPGVGVNFSTATEKLPNTLSICLPEGLTAQTVLNEGCKDKLLASLGAACHSNTEKPSAILLASGLSPAEASRTIRLSVGRTTTVKEVEEAVKVLKKACLSQQFSPEKCMK